VGDLLRVILDAIQYIWPFRLVREWERANFYVCGRYWREVGPGVYPVVPWFMDVHAASVAPGIVSTHRQDITLADGTMLSFSASAWAQVTSMNLAVNRVDDYTQTVREIVEAVLADKFAAVDVERLATDKRARLLSDCRRWIQDECAPFGIEVSKLRLTSFVTRLRAHRLLIDQVQDYGTW